MKYSKVHHESIDSHDVSSNIPQDHLDVVDTLLDLEVADACCEPAMLLVPGGGHVCEGFQN